MTWGKSFLVGIGMVLALPASATQLTVIATPGGQILETYGAVVAVTVTDAKVLTITAQKGTCVLKLPVGEVTSMAKLLADDIGKNIWSLQCRSRENAKSDVFNEYTLATE